MIALGIDPGTAICGYGFVETHGSRLRPLAYGSLFTPPDMPMEPRRMQSFDAQDADAVSRGGMRKCINNFAADFKLREDGGFHKETFSCKETGHLQTQRCEPTTAKHIEPRRPCQRCFRWKPPSGPPATKTSRARTNERTLK